MYLMQQFVLKNGQKIEIITNTENDTFEQYVDKMFRLINNPTTEAISLTSATGEEYLAIRAADISAYSSRTARV